MKLAVCWTLVLPFPVLGCLFLLLEYKVFPKYCSFIVWCEKTSTKLWYFEDSGCQNVSTGSNLVEEMFFWRVVWFLLLSFASCSSLIRSWMTYLLCQWFYIWELSKSWECLPFFGAVCLGGKKKNKFFSWLGFLSWNCFSISRFFYFGHWSNLSAYHLGTVTHPPHPPMCFTILGPSVLFPFPPCPFSPTLYLKCCCT